MSLIIGNKVDTLMRGYPTVSDKYNVRGATLSSTSPVGYFGDVVKIDGDGYFSVVNATNTLTSASEVGGVLLATNVKVPHIWPAGYSSEVTTEPGEAFNLMIDGYVALPVNVEGTDGANPTKDQLKAVQDTIKEGTDAKLTSNGKVSPTGTIDMGWKFTGITFIDSQNELLAEVVVYPKNI